MSFFSRIKEKATAGIKAAEKYITAEEKKLEEELSQQEAMSKPQKATTPHHSLSADPTFAQATGQPTIKRQASFEDPLQMMVRQAAEEAKNKAKPVDPEIGGQTPQSELQKLKIILRNKMKEHEDFVEEANNRDHEYQKLLQENDIKIKQTTEQERK